MSSNTSPVPSPTIRRRIERSLRAERHYLGWWVLIFLAVAARVAWSAWIAHAHPAAVTSGDTPGYLGPARALIDNGHFNVSAHSSIPMFLRTPGYPAVLAATLWLTNSVWAISPLQAAASLVPVIATVALGRRVLAPAAAMLAGAIVALDPLQFALSGTILTETLATLTLIGVAAAGLAVFGHPPARVRARASFGLGASIAAATMVRPTTYYLPPFVVVLLVVRFRRVPPRRLIAMLLAFAVPLIAVVGGWELRNHYRVDSWQLSSSAAITLYCYNAASVQAKATHVTVKAARDELGCNPGGWDELKNACPTWWRCALPDRSAYGPGYDEMNTRGVRIIRKHPEQTVEVVAAGFVREVFGPGTDTVSRFLNVRSATWLGVPLFLWNAALMLLAFVGVFVALRSTKRAFWASLIALVAYVLVASAGAETSARFRTPLVPLIGLLAALAVQHGGRWLRVERDAPDDPTAASAAPLEAIE